MIYLVDLALFAYVKSHQEGDTYECITKKVIPNSKELVEETQVLILQSVNS